MILTPYCYWPVSPDDDSSQITETVKGHNASTTGNVIDDYVDSTIACSLTDMAWGVYSCSFLFQFENLEPATLITMSRGYVYNSISFNGSTLSSYSRVRYGSYAKSYSSSFTPSINKWYAMTLTVEPYYSFRSGGWNPRFNFNIDNTDIFASHPQTRTWFTSGAYGGSTSTSINCGFATGKTKQVKYYTNIDFADISVISGLALVPLDRLPGSSGSGFSNTRNVFL